jgi:streptomycin 6-kinase
LVEVPEVVRNKALAAGATAWLDGLPELVAGLERDWDITVGAPFADGTEAYVAAATRADGTEAVLKLCIPRELDAARREIAVLRQASGCVALLADDVDRGALLLERLGPSMADLDLPLDQRLPLLADAAAEVWRPATGSAGFPTGAEKARWLASFVGSFADPPCAPATVVHAIACAASREAAHGRAVLCHGDVHQWNALRAGTGWKLIDPDGLLAEPEYDLGVLLREDPDTPDVLRDRCAWLAARTGLDPTAIWEWGVVERVATGLVCEQIGLQPIGRQLLLAADAVARQH